MVNPSLQNCSLIKKFSQINIFPKLYNLKENFTIKRNIEQALNKVKKL